MSFIASRPQTALLVVVLAVVLTAISGDVVWVDTGVMIGIYGLLALSVGLSYGQAGILSLAQAPLAAIGAYATAILTTNHGWPPLASLLVSLALPTVLAYGLARLVIRLEPLAVALATLAMGFIVEIAIRNADELTGGYLGLAGIPGLSWFPTPLSYLLLTWAVVVVAVFIYENLVNSAQGRALATIKHDRARALADGVPVTRLLGNALALSATFAGMSGWLYAHYLSYLGPTDLGAHLSISVLLMAVVGGLNGVLGPILGAVLLSILLRLLPAQEYQGLFYGGALIVILLFARDGILGLIEGAWRVVRGWRRSARPMKENVR